MGTLTRASQTSRKGCLQIAEDEETGKTVLNGDGTNPVQQNDQSWNTMAMSFPRINAFK